MYKNLMNFDKRECFTALPFEYKNNKLIIEFESNNEYLLKDFKLLNYKNKHIFSKFNGDFKHLTAILKKPSLNDIIMFQSYNLFWSLDNYRGKFIEQMREHNFIIMNFEEKKFRLIKEANLCGLNYKKLLDKNLSIDDIKYILERDGK